MGRGILRGKGRPIVKYRETLRPSVQRRKKLIETLFRLWAEIGPRNHVLDVGSDPHGKEQFWGMGRP